MTAEQIKFVKGLSHQQTHKSGKVSPQRQTKAADLVSTTSKSSQTSYVLFSLCKRYMRDNGKNKDKKPNSFEIP